MIEVGARADVKPNLYEMGKGGVFDPVDNNNLYEVKQICNHRFRSGEYRYEINWKNYDAEENTWERAANLPKQMFKEYNQANNIGNYFPNDKILAKILLNSKR